MMDSRFSDLINDMQIFAYWSHVTIDVGYMALAINIFVEHDYEFSLERLGLVMLYLLDSFDSFTIRGR